MSFETFTSEDLSRPLQISSTDHLSRPYTSVCRSSYQDFPALNPKPWSYQIYITFPPATMDVTYQSSLAEKLLLKLTKGLANQDEHWRIDIHQMPDTTTTDDCTQHYLTLKEFRGMEVEKSMHTVSSYRGELISTELDNVLFIIDGGRWMDLEEGKSEDGTSIRCVEFGLADEDKEINEEKRNEEAEGETGLFGKRAQEYRMGVHRVGEWMQCIWKYAEVTSEYEYWWWDQEVRENAGDYFWVGD